MEVVARLVAVVPEEVLAVLREFVCRFGCVKSDFLFGLFWRQGNMPQGCRDGDSVFVRLVRA